MSNRPTLSVLPMAEWPPPPGDRLPCALMLVTADGLVHSANTTARAWFSPPPSPGLLPLTRFLGVLDADSRASELREFVDALRQTGHMRELRLGLYRHDGGKFSALLSGTPLIDPSGVYLGFDALLLDLSRWEDREALVPYTHGEALERSLDSARRAHSLAQRDIDAFSQILSHELRAPLRHAKGYLRLLREQLDENSSETQREYTLASLRAVDGMGSMIDALLDFARLSNGLMDMQPVPLAPLVSSVLAHLGRHPHAATVEWCVADDLPVVRGDPMLLAQAFSHLLDNALKFTRSVAQPRVELVWEDTGQGSRRFTVRDNGVGFDSRAADKLFMLFQRQHHSLDYEGLGVGLAMTRRIVERHGGSVQCEASRGGGCSVSFTLPYDLRNGAF